MKKLILIGVLGGIVVLIIGMLTGQIFQRLFPALTTEYQNVHLFRTWSDPVMLMYFVHPFFFGIAFRLGMETDEYFVRCRYRLAEGLSFWIRLLDGVHRSRHDDLLRLLRHIPAHGS